MSRVDRYWHVVDLTEDPEGDYVSYNDYEAIEEERDKLKKMPRVSSILRK
jgi:hypothetical protein